MIKTVYWFVYSGRNNFLVVPVDRALYVEKCGVVTFDIIMNEPFNRKSDNSFRYLADVAQVFNIHLKVAIYGCNVMYEEEEGDALIVTIYKYFL